MKTRVALSVALAILCFTSVPLARAAGPLSLETALPLGSAIAYDVALAGTFAYVATSTGLTVVDVSSPARPTVRGSVAAGRCLGVEVNGDIAVAACTTALKLIDVSNPAAPRVVGSRTLPYAWDVALKGTFAYVSSLAGELYVVNIGNAAAPALVKTIGLIAWRSPTNDAGNLERLRAGVTVGNAKASGVFVTGDDLVTVDWGYGRLYYYKVTNPGVPVFAGTHEVPYVLKAIVHPVHKIVYLLSAYARTSGIYTVPLNSLDPTVASTHASCTTCTYLSNTKNSVGLDQGGLALAPSGEHLFYGGGRYLGEFHVVDVTPPPAMTDSAMTDIGVHRVALGLPMGGEAHDDLIYFAAGALGVHIYRFPGL